MRWGRSRSEGATTMAGAIWCVVEDDRKGMPKKVMAEVIGEAARLGGPAEAVWLTDKASDDGFTQLAGWGATRSEEHTSELQSHSDLVCRLLLEKKKCEQRSSS